MICRICYADAETRHLPLYISESEGLDICHGCEMELLTIIRSMIRTAHRSREEWVVVNKSIMRNKGND